MRRWRGFSSRADEGFVTVEAAIAIPALVAVAIAGAGLSAAAVRQAQLVDVARGMARDISRGDDDHARIWRRSLPAGVIVKVDTGSGAARVRLEDPLRLGGLMSQLPPLRLRAEASATMEGE